MLTREHSSIEFRHCFMFHSITRKVSLIVASSVLVSVSSLLALTAQSRFLSSYPLQHDHMDRSDLSHVESSRVESVDPTIAYFYVRCRGKITWTQNHKVSEVSIRISGTGVFVNAEGQFAINRQLINLANPLQQLEPRPIKNLTVQFVVELKVSMADVLLFLGSIQFLSKRLQRSINRMLVKR